MKKTKSKLLSFLLIAGLLLSVMAPLLEVQTAQAATYTGATTYNGHTYCIFPTSMSWSEAKVYCEKVGGHLATITSAKEQAFIEQLNSSSKRLWIGAYRDEYFLWYWVTGEKWDYTNWKEGEPNNQGTETCVAVWPSEWNDLGAGSSEQTGFICEWDTATNTKYAFTKQKQTITGLQNFSKTYKAGKLNKKSYTVKLAGTAENKLTYSKVSGSSKIKVSAAGKITIPKNLKKGTYVVKVKATAAGSKFYKKTAKTVTVKIIVK